MNNEQLLKLATSFTAFSAEDFLKHLSEKYNIEAEHLSSSEQIRVEKTSSFPERWAIRTHNCWSKSEKAFVYECSPSSRNEEFYKDMRYDSLDEALAVALEIKDVYEKAFDDWFKWVFVDKKENPYIAGFLQQKKKKKFGNKI